MTEEDTTAANNYLNQYISLSSEDASSEEFVSIGPAEFYIVAGNLEKAEEYLRQELSAQPDNVYRIYKLAMFLIDKERNKANIMKHLKFFRNARIRESIMSLQYIFTLKLPERRLQDFNRN